MKAKDQDLKWKLCDAYFSILNSTNFNSINLKDLCLKSKVSYDEAKKLFLKTELMVIFFSYKLLLLN